MEGYLPTLYLLLLLGLLGGTSWFVVRQIFQTRRLESALAKLQAKLNREKGSTQEHFELGSIFLSKKVTLQAIGQFQQALKTAETEQETDIAPIYNALGYAYFLQEQYDLAIRNYKEALKIKPDYPTALNNLGHAYERKNLAAQALDAYEQALVQDPKNGIARQRATTLKRRLVTTK